MNIKHGLYKHPLYTVWLGMKRRCNNKKNDSYKYYGNRGIKICLEWENNFKSFYNWTISSGWKSNLEIDRIDNECDYCPKNCRFVTKSENQKNKRGYGITGIKHIYKNKNKFVIYKYICGKPKYFGTFDTLEEAKNKLKELENEWQV